MAAERGAETSRRVSDILKRAADDIRSMDVGEYKARAMDAMDSARARVDDAAEMEREMIRNRPLTSVAVAVGVGMLAGMAVALVGSRMISRYEYE